MSQLDQSVISAAVFQSVADSVFSAHKNGKGKLLESLVEDVFAASAAGEEGVFLQSALIVLPSIASLTNWQETMNIARIHTIGAFGGLGLSASLRRHAPLLRATDFGFISPSGIVPELVGVGTALVPIDRSSLISRVRQTKSVLIEVQAPLSIRFDNGEKAIAIRGSRYQFPAAPEKDTTHVLQKVTQSLGLQDRAVAILEQLVETLRLARHGALYVIADDSANLEKLFPNSIRADWDALSLHTQTQPSGVHPTRLVNSYAGFGMMDGAVVLNKNLSLLRYRAYYEIERKQFVEGGGRSRAFARLSADIQGRKPSGLLAAIKLSTDGDLTTVTPKRRR
jgi:hypothetical protein